MIDLSKCKKGDRLKTRGGHVVVYEGTGVNEDYPKNIHRASGLTYTNEGKFLAHLTDNSDIIEIMQKTKEERIKEVEAQLKQAQQDLQAIREEPDTPPLELKDKHIYRRRDGEIAYAFAASYGWLVICGDQTFTDYNGNGSYPSRQDKFDLVECIGKIGVVAEWAVWTPQQRTGAIAYDPNHLTGKPIQ